MSRRSKIKKAKIQRAAIFSLVDEIHDLSYGKLIGSVDYRKLKRRVARFRAIMVARKGKKYIRDIERRRQAYSAY